MANVQYTENMTEEQLDSMAGGDNLRYLATSYGISRNNKVLMVWDVPFLYYGQKMFFCVCYRSKVCAWERIAVKHMNC